MHVVSVDKDVEAVQPRLPEDFIGAAAQENARPLLGEAEDDGLLHVVNGVLAVAVKDAGRHDPPDDGVGPGDVLPLPLHQVPGIAAGLRRLGDNIPVIEGDAQFLRNTFPHGVAARAVFPANGDDAIHNPCPLFPGGTGTGPIPCPRFIFTGVLYHVPPLRATALPRERSARGFSLRRERLTVPWGSSAGIRCPLRRYGPFQKPQNLLRLLRGPGGQVL